MSREFLEVTSEEELAKIHREIVAGKDAEIAELKDRIKFLESLKAKKTKRRGEDFYPTPVWAVWGLLENCPTLKTMANYRHYWLEPAAGDGAIVKAVETAGLHPRWHMLDVRQECQPQLEKVHTATNNIIETGVVFQMWQQPEGFSVTITNPPYSRKQPEQFVMKAMQY